MTTTDEQNQSTAVYLPHPRLVNPENRAKPWVSSMAEYEALYKESLEQPDQFWTRMASETLTWDRPFRAVSQGSLNGGDMVWFPEGRLNVAYNCVDRWARADPDRVAFVYEADEPGQSTK
ncbi:acetyl-coenzyme A synthetase 2, partial [Coemansia spiralis]